MADRIDIMMPDRKDTTPAKVNEAHETAATAAGSVAVVPRPGLDSAGEDGAQRLGDWLDRTWHAFLARRTKGLSPLAVTDAYSDWMTHLAASPGKQAQLVEKAARKAARLGRFATQCALHPEATPSCIEPLAQDRRFRDPAWQRWPFNVLHQSFLLQQQWWHVATTGIHGLDARHEAQVNFATRQALDTLSPTNFLATNPVVLQKTWAEGGANLMRGWLNLLEDWQRSLNGNPPHGADAHAVGRDLAISPGKVIYRNRLIELIQYAATTETVHPEPVLIVPAWIMKYYILDLTPQNSLVKYLTDRGFTVFMISWKNPDYEDRDLGIDDYRNLGVLAALEAVNTVVPGQKVHAVGYCLGGTLLSIAAAAMARDGDDRLASLSFLATQTDFEEAGELTLFMVESQVAFLEDMMREQGYLDVHQMAGAFQMLHSNDLVWSRMVHDYLMGERSPMNALMAWNADGTRMPARMHSQYLRQLFLKNDLAEGRFRVEGRPIALTDLRLPLFVVAAETDHVAPWHSVFKFHLLTDTEMTFLLASGGHNGGIVSEPGHKGRHFRLRNRQAQDRYIDPDSWLAQTTMQEGSWWPVWADWLAQRAGARVVPPPMGAPDRGLDPLADAPGSYVLQA